MLALPGWRVASCRDLGNLTIVEDGETFQANAEKKVAAYLGLTDAWVLADDSGLVVPALDGAPGVHSARYAKPHDDQANNEKLLKAMAKLEGDQRRAHFVCTMVLGHQGRIVFSGTGKVEGSITASADGQGGFGYDPLFFYGPAGKTFAAMSGTEKNDISHRGRALAKVRAFLMDHGPKPGPRDA